MSYTLEISSTQPDVREELLKEAVRVVERRLDSMGEELIDQSIDAGGENPTLTLTLVDDEIAEFLTQDLTSPFTMDIMKEVPEGTGDITVSGHGSFAKTGVTAEHLDWVNAREDGTSGKGMVRLVFTPEGRVLMAQVFAENVGKNIGLFVRDKLVSKLYVDTAELKDDIVIRDIPSLDFAHVFAEDVNVGLHVTFIPIE